MTLKIGSLELKKRVIQAPMCGVSGVAYRTIAQDFGCELGYPPMSYSSAVVRGRDCWGERMDRAKGETPFGIQLIGTEPEEMGAAAKICEQEGAMIVDVNLGCPSRKVVNRGAGAALLRTPDRVREIVGAMSSAVDIPVTVKMRQGYNTDDEWQFLDVAEAAVEGGAAALILHGRTRKKQHRGPANREAIRRLKETSSVPVIGNGDVFGPEDAKTMFDETGCDAVMVARGAMGNPWIYESIEHFLDTGEVLPEPTPEEICEVLRRHWDLVMETIGPKSGPLYMRGVVCWYWRGGRNVADIRRDARHIKCREDFEVLLNRYLDANSLNGRNGMPLDAVGDPDGRYAPNRDSRSRNR